MIRVQLGARERELSYEEFIRSIQEGQIGPETPVYSEVLTSGTWKAAGQLQLFRVWAPKESLPPEEEDPAPREPAPPPIDEPAPPPSPPAESPPTAPIGGEEPGTPGPIPWEMMEKIGFGAALLWTVSLAFRGVDEFFLRIGRGRTVLPPLTFGLFIVAIATLFQAFYDALFVSRFGPMLEEIYRSSPGLAAGQPGPIDANQIFLHAGLRILLYPVAALLWSAVIQLFLRSFGKDWGGLARTFRVVNYATAPLLLTIFPFCGNVVGLIWSLVLTVLGISRVHRVQGVAATVAVLVPVVIAACILGLSVLQPLGQLMSGIGEGLPS